MSPSQKSTYKKYVWAVYLLRNMGCEFTFYKWNCFLWRRHLEKLATGTLVFHEKRGMKNHTSNHSFFCIYLFEISADTPTFVGESGFSTLNFYLLNVSAVNSDDLTRKVSRCICQLYYSIGNILRFSEMTCRDICFQNNFFFFAEPTVHIGINHTTGECIDLYVAWS